jgi:hypothetical protein
MASTLKQATIDGVTKAERFRIEAWVQFGYDAIEAEAFVYPCLCRPAAGALPAQEVALPVQVTLDAAARSALFSAVKAAVDAKLAEG